MRNFAFTMCRKAFWVAYVLALVVSSLMPVAFPEAPEGSDKALHLLAYCLLVAFWPPAWLRPAAVMFSFAAVLGVVLEIAQGVLPTSRFADPWDAVANCLGAGLGLACLQAWRIMGRGAA
ncbi:VanZ family protein [Desulfomicrobium salsuginis]